MQNHFSKIKLLNNQELLSRTKILVQKERDIHIQVLHHLAEINSRKLYLEQGFSSLFDYAVRELGYSEGAAYRRIKAMKLCQDLPGTEDQLQSGMLSLSTASQLQVFFEKQAKKAKEKKKESLLLRTSGETVTTSSKKLEYNPWPSEQPISGGERKKEESGSSFSVSNQSLSSEEVERNKTCRSLSREDKENLVKKAEGCSTRAMAKLLSETDPSLFLPREKTHFLGKGKVGIKVVIDEECHKNLEKLKSLLSHRNPSLSYGELFSILSEEGLKKHDPRLKIPQKRAKTKVQEETSAEKEENKRDKVAEEVASPGKKSASLAGKLKRNKIITRYIPSYLRKYVWKRDGGQCTYVHHETKRRCASRYLLQIDHIQPFALGGKTEKGNLRLLCANHNQFRK